MPVTINAPKKYDQNILFLVKRQKTKRKEKQTAKIIIPPPRGVGFIWELLSFGISSKLFFLLQRMKNELPKYDNKNAKMKQIIYLITLKYKKITLVQKPKSVFLMHHQFLF